MENGSFLKEILILWLVGSWIHTWVPETSFLSCHVFSTLRKANKMLLLFMDMLSAELGIINILLFAFSNLQAPCTSLQQFTCLNRDWFRFYSIPQLMVASQRQYCIKGWAKKTYCVKYVFEIYQLDRIKTSKFLSLSSILTP